ncbi:MAG: aspartate carbamoyltransferase [Rhodomicrobium sp.]|nr:MAG: aspartate carbamoyltransferase [Rhodomicrobium sp.]
MVDPETIQKAQRAHEEGSVEFEPEKPDIYGDAHPKELLRLIPEHHDVLKSLANKHIVSAFQFDKEMLEQLFRLAAKYESNPNRYSNPLKGKILISAFYEPSTRTRLSFESAWHRLGGDIMSITDRASTGIAKGESLRDIGEMFNNYGDCVVLRDNSEDAVIEMMQTLRIPIINAGNGTDEHPTQALADLYTILKWRPAMMEENSEPIKIGIIGNPARMRTVRSLLTLLSNYSDAISEIIIIHDDKDEQLFYENQEQEIKNLGLKIRTETNLDKVLPELDVVYINAIAWVKDDYEVMGENLKLSINSPLKPSSIILHPLARGDELCSSLDNTPHNWYFSQARGAVFLRMALLTCLTQRTERVIDVL